MQPNKEIENALKKIIYKELTKESAGYFYLKLKRTRFEMDLLGAW